MPDPFSDRIALHLTPAAVRAVRDGHPWVFDQAVVRQNRSTAAGALAVLFDRKRRFVGIGLYDPDSPIRVRVLHQGAPATIDRQWLAARIQTACDRRTPLIAASGTTGYRLVHGENDGLPGLVVDRYDTTTVLKLDTAAWMPYLPLLTTIVARQADAERIVLRLSRTVRHPDAVDGAVIRGPALDGPVLFTENGITFEADPVAGQKTGFFLDQRDNRARVERLAAGRSVLNVFSYTGGFSLYAARGGARDVTDLDCSRPALDAAARNFRHNRHVPAIAASERRTLCGDAFDALQTLSARGDRFGMVILDPPSFARRQRELDGALDAYRRLVTLGLRLLADNGILVAASCSARVPPEAFFDAILDAGGARCPLAEIERTGHALDHPVGFPEGRYLKCLFARRQRQAGSRE